MKYEIRNWAPIGEFGFVSINVDLSKREWINIALDRRIDGRTDVSNCHVCDENHTPTTSASSANCFWAASSCRWRDPLPAVCLSSCWWQRSSSSSAITVVPLVAIITSLPPLPKTLQHRKTSWQQRHLYEDVINAVHSAVVLFLSPDQLSGTCFHTNWETTVKRAASRSHWKHCSSVSISVSSAWEVYLYTTMRYINRPFTYLLTGRWTNPYCYTVTCS